MVRGIYGINIFQDEEDRKAPTSTDALFLPEVRCLAFSINIRYFKSQSIFLLGIGAIEGGVLLIEYPFGLEYS
jgi:hypothetical protein